jgi:hypothetical protein
MGKLSKKIKKAAIAGAALYAANKAMTGSIGRHQASKSLAGDKFAKARRLMTSNDAYRGKPGNLSKMMGMDRKSPIKILGDESRTNLNTRTRTGNINRMKLWAAKQKNKLVPKKRIYPTGTGPGTGRVNRAKGGITKARGGVYVNTKLNGKVFTETF